VKVSVIIQRAINIMKNTCLIVKNHCQRMKCKHIFITQRIIKKKFISEKYLNKKFINERKLDKDLCECAGYLKKQGQKIKNWKTRL
jgi:hypothetical protein